METFEYVAVLTSIIIGLGMAQLLMGVTRLIQHPEQAKPNWIHLCWVFYMFLFSIFWWWWEFRLGTIEVWTFGIYLFVILYAFLVFLLCALLFPRDFSGYDGFKDYFYAKRAWFFSVFILSQLADIADSMIKGLDYYYSLGFHYTATQLAIVAFSVTAIFTKNDRFHGIFVLALIAYMVFSGFTLYDTVS
ncbi:MAG: hypothetical protein OEM03_12730 [Chromatiales bacterium]|nr:hypothetical protein [Chromatiales bacterium]